MDSVLDVVNAASSSAIGRRPNAFGSGQRTLSKDSQFTSDNCSDTDDATGGPGTPSKKRKTQARGIVLPEKAAVAPPRDMDRSGEMDEAALELLIAASQKSGYVVLHRLSPPSLYLYAVGGRRHRADN